MKSHEYVHGYSDREQERLLDQANTLAELLHHDTFYPAGSTVLEAGCGVGAQTVILAQKSPEAHFTSVDISPVSLETARTSIEQRSFSNVKFCAADVFNLPFKADSFDHVFVCFLLEHLRKPLEALKRLKMVLKPGGTITVIEGDHGSAYFYPESRFAKKAIDCLVKVQSDMGGNALIGRQLYPLIKQAGFRDVHISPRQVYADASRPEWVKGFTKNTFNAMVDGAKDQALKKRMIDLKTWEQGIADLHAAAGKDGTFSYTFFKGIAVK
jgi:ubiquinone/menaquinone biosynthesis C-methylase UbiE